MGLVIRQTVFTVDPNNLFGVETESRWKLSLLKIVDKIVAKLLLGFVRKVLGLSLILPHKVDILEKRFDLREEFIGFFNFLTSYSLSGSI